MKRNSLNHLELAGDPPSAHLSPVEAEVIHLFMQLCRALGKPPSLAEIYGLLFVSPRPLPQDDFYDRLNMCKGTASQGLRYLLELGAVRVVYVSGDRRLHYEAVAELRQVAGRFLQQEIMTRFEDSPTRFERLAAAAQKLSGEERKFVGGRVKQLRTWEKNGRRLLPLVARML